MRCPTEASSVDSTDSDWDCTSTVPPTGVNCPTTDTGSLEVDLPHRSPLLPLPDEWGLAAGTIHPEVPPLTLKQPLWVAPLATLHHRVLRGNQCMKGLSEQRRDGLISITKHVLAYFLFIEKGRRAESIDEVMTLAWKDRSLLWRDPLGLSSSHIFFLLFVFSAAVPEEATETVGFSAMQVTYSCWHWEAGDKVVLLPARERA